MPQQVGYGYFPHSRCTVLISEYDEMVYWWLADIIQSTEAGDIQFHNGN